MRLSAMPSAKPLPRTSPSGFSCAHMTNWRFERKHSSTPFAPEGSALEPLVVVLISLLIASLHLVDDVRHADALCYGLVADERERGRSAHAQPLAELDAQESRSALQSRD